MRLPDNTKMRVLLAHLRHCRVSMRHHVAPSSGYRDMDDTSGRLPSKVQGGAVSAPAAGTQNPRPRRGGVRQTNNRDTMPPPPPMATTRRRQMESATELGGTYQPPVYPPEPVMPIPHVPQALDGFVHPSAYDYAAQQQHQLYALQQQQQHSVDYSAMEGGMPSQQSVQDDDQDSAGDEAQ
jgi:hypothetical protein